MPFKEKNKNQKDSEHETHMTYSRINKKISMAEMK